MFTIFAALLITLLAVSAVSSLTTRRSEECWVVVYCGFTFYLYCFYCIDALRFGLWTLLAGILGLFLFSCLKKKSVKHVISNTFSSGTVGYLALCTIFSVMLSGNRAMLHDELRLWAAVPKMLHISGRLQLGNTVPIFQSMQSYPPAFPLLGYFFSAFSPEFHEGSLYVAYACVTVSAVLPALKNYEKKNWYAPAPSLFLIYTTMLILTSHMGDRAMFGMSLFVDLILGVFSGLLFFMAGHKPFKDWFSAISFCLVLAVTILLKDTGILFAGFALAAALLLNGNTLKSFLAVGVTVAVCISWKVVLLVHGVSGFVHVESQGMTSDSIRNVLQALVLRNVVLHRIPFGFLFSFAVIFALLWGMYYFIYRIQTEQTAKESLTVAGAILAASIFFLWGYTIIYGATMESYERYVETLLAALMVCILLTLIPLLPETKAAGTFFARNTGMHIVVSLCIIIACIGSLFVWKKIYTVVDLSNDDAAASRIQASVASELQPGEQGNIYLVIVGDAWDTSRTHHRIYFNLLSENITIRNFFTQTQIPAPDAVNPVLEWAEELKNGYQFVYLLSVDEPLTSIFESLSPDVPEAYCLYRVNSANNSYGIILNKVQ